MVLLHYLLLTHHPRSKPSTNTFCRGFFIVDSTLDGLYFGRLPFYISRVRPHFHFRSRNSTLVRTVQGLRLPSSRSSTCPSTNHYPLLRPLPPSFGGLRSPGTSGSTVQVQIRLTETSHNSLSHDARLNVQFY